MNLTEKIYEALEMTSDDSRAFYNVSSGEIVWLNEYIEGYEELAEEIDNNFENYIPLPTKYDINEYSMMRDFAKGYPDSEVSSRLCRAVSGRGAFRYFKDSVYDMGIEQEWFAFRDGEYKKIAEAWRKENNL